MSHPAYRRHFCTTSRQQHLNSTPLNSTPSIPLRSTLLYSAPLHPTRLDGEGEEEEEDHFSCLPWQKDFSPLFSSFGRGGGGGGGEVENEPNASLLARMVAATLWTKNVALSASTFYYVTNARYGFSAPMPRPTRPVFSFDVGNWAMPSRRHTTPALAFRRHFRSAGTLFDVGAIPLLSIISGSSK